jgi:hypothetical protein
MKHTKQGHLNDSLALILSVAIHGVFLLVAYYLSMNHSTIGSSTAYKIELDLQTYHQALNQPTQEVNHNKVQDISPSISQESTIESIPSHKTPLPVAIEESNQEIILEQQAPVIKDNPAEFKEDKEEQPTIDSRGLYKPTEDKRTGASLELVGWTWDTVPHPQDDTNEIGRLVFEIIIDDAGEIIAIKTLEKTVSPLVEQLYKDEVAKLTFSKTSKHITYAPTSTGRITFIIQYK